MAFGIGEFPHTNYSDTDEKELIELYKKLNNNYAGTLDKISSLETRLNNYEYSTDKEIEEIRESLIKSVRSAVEQAVDAYQKDTDRVVNNLNRTVTDATEAMKNVSSSISEDMATFKKLIDKQEKELEDRLAARVNSAIKEVNVRMKSIEAENIYLRKYIKTMYDSFATRTDQYDSDIRMLMQEELQNTLNACVEYADALSCELEKKIAEINAIANGDAIKWLWQSGLGIGGFSCIEWSDFTECSCLIWNVSKVSCSEWYVDGKRKLKWVDYRSMFFSPVSGFKVTPQIAIYEIANKIRATITAKEYDDLLMTAEQYDSKEITAYDYDWERRI